MRGNLGDLSLKVLLNGNNEGQTNVRGTLVEVGREQLTIR